LCQRAADNAEKQNAPESDRYEYTFAAGHGFVNDWMIFA
jgi:hypothetical protein